MMGRFLAIGILALLSIAEANAANDAAGATCLESCRTNLKKAGLWSSYPYGYCRNKCGYWTGAEKDKR
jgi:hypothetical protein